MTDWLCVKISSLVFCEKIHYEDVQGLNIQFSSAVTESHEARSFTGS